MKTEDAKKTLCPRNPRPRQFQKKPKKLASDEEITLAGCRKRCEVISCEDLRQLVIHFRCAVGDVPEKLHRPKEGKR